MKVTYLGGTPQNVMKWTNVYSEKGGTYDITVSYASEENRYLKITVNNGQPVIYKDLNTGSYSKYNTLTVRGTLKKGNNTITLGCDNGYAPDIDGITVVKK